MNQFESGEALVHPEAEKEGLWNAKFREVQEYQDIAGHKMDDGIIETVTALNVNDIPTFQSCAGHIETGMLPNVQIQLPSVPKGVHKKGDVITPEWKQWRKQADALEEKVQQLLEEFYHDREIKSGITLKLDESHQIIATSKEIEEIWADEPYTEQEEAELETIMKPWVPLAQEEMRAFTLFLKGKFFEK